MHRIALVVTLLMPGIVFAQPQPQPQRGPQPQPQPQRGPEPGPGPQPEPGPQPPQSTLLPSEPSSPLAHAQAATVAPPSRTTQCKLERAAMMRDAQVQPDAASRQRILLALPDCAKVEAEDNRPPAGPGDAPRPRGGATAELGIGFGLFSGGGETQVAHGPALELGVGSFVTPKVALSVRLAGNTTLEGDTELFAGFVGPAAQLWLAGQAWVGVGLGVSFLAGCGGGGCGEYDGVGVDLRFGYALHESGRGANISLELTTVDRLTTLGFLVGLQSF